MVYLVDPMNVPFFNYPRVYTEDRDALMGIFDEVGSRGAFILQKDLRDFEAALATYTGARYAMTD